MDFQVKNMKLRFKILLMCLGCTLFALVLQTFLFQETSSKLIYRLSQEESENSLQNMQKEIYRFVKNIENNLLETYTEEDFIKALKSDMGISELRSRFYRKAYDIGTGKFETEDNVVSLYLYTPQHEIISCYRRAVTPRHNYQTDIYEDVEGQNARAVQDYIGSERSVMLISSYYNSYREKDILRFVMKLYYNSNRQEQIGYVVCDVDSKVFSSIMEKYYTDNTVYIWLQPRGDRPAVSVGNLTETEASYYQEALEAIQSGGEAVIADSSRQELFQAGQSRYDLTAYSIMPQWVLQQNQRALTMNLILIAMLMLAAATVLTILVSRNLTHPLDLLMDTIHRIKEGDTSLRTQVIHSDEIGMLGRNFNEMLDQMEELRDKENRTNLLLAQARYQALQAQINPHFLYNTLDTMSSIAEIRDCPEVSMLSQSLSNIFRYSLNMKDPFSTVAKEIVHLKNYSYVMGVRMQDHIAYIYEIEPETLKDLIPRISLQPLVENALNHGLRNKRGKKEIRITARHRGEELLICVEDNGVGMDAGVLNEQLQKNDPDYVGHGKSIGLHNINARLKMLYGDAYGIHIVSRIGEGTKVCLNLPGRQEEKQDGKANV